MAKSCQPQQQLKFLLEYPSAGHGEILLLTLILNKAAIQDQLVIEISQAIDALPDRFTCLGMCPCIPVPLYS